MAEISPLLADAVRLEQVRSEFPHTAQGIYLNHAATGPLARRTRDAVARHLDARHRGGIDTFDQFVPILERGLERIARLLGTTPDRVEYAPNTSSALSILAEGLDWRPGDRVALPACEFPANVYPFLHLERRGVAIDWIPHDEGTFDLETVAATLRPETRVLSVSWVQFLSGFRSDLVALGRLCRARGVIFCVDAIQGLGALRLDVEAAQIDFLACGAHKWLMSTQGIGFLYIREEVQDRVTPRAGWLHGPVDWDRFYDYDLQFHSTAERFRLGTLNSVGVISLEAALSLYEEAGPEWCEARVLHLARLLGRGFERMGLARYGSAAPEHGAGIVTVRHPDPDGLMARLRAAGVTVSLRNRLVRLAPTYYNTEAEIEQVLALLEDDPT